MKITQSPDEASLPMLCKQDVAIYLGQILPELSAMAKTSGLKEIEEVLALAANLTLRHK